MNLEYQDAQAKTANQNKKLTIMSKTLKFSNG